MKYWRVSLILVVLTMVLCGSVSAVVPQNSVGNCRYFVETGHYVCSDFLSYFENRGQFELFGYPLTEAFNDPIAGLWVQYFQRARMELHPGQPEPYRVQLGLLVDELGYVGKYPQAAPEAIPAFNNALHHYFPETGYVVSYAFLDYFRDKGGLDIFGYPRSEFLYEDGYMVQYFQRAKMEWHPEAADGPEMRLANLGEIYLERFAVAGDAADPVRPSVLRDPASEPVTDLRATASVRHMITGQTGTQTVFVYVNDQQAQPVQGANVGIIVRYKSGDQSYTCGLTDATGFARCSFDLNSPEPGRKVPIDVLVGYRDLSGTTKAFFLPWW